MNEPSHSEQTTPYEAGTPPELTTPHQPPGEPPPELTALLRHQAERWGRGDCVRAEDLLDQAPALAADAAAAVDVIAHEVLLRTCRGETLVPAEYLQRFPHLEAQLRLHFALDRNQAAGPPPTVAAQAGRYQLLGEIARGGMGAVLRGRDPELNRDLAIKVLLDRYHDDPHMLRRFLTEARISGSLQHPGVVPIYELGRLADQRPFLAMKLVEGRTLADLLKERSGEEGAPGSWPDLPRFLAVFAQVCQAVAYAHSRGVIHRDLKPGNIMVGAFGEVQVMDWGLAKALNIGAGQESFRAAGARDTAGASSPTGIRDAEVSADAQTHAGTVLGTLAYMPPEQARGEVDSLDERCDVFALGAILCQILTGQAPYASRHKAEVHQKAMRGDLAEAFARLDGCGAERDLIALAQRCLATDRDERPRRAGAVAEAVEHHQAVVQERLRRAELERAEARVQALEERKRREVEQAKARAERQRRRVTVALAASLLLLVVSASAAGLWYQADQAKRQAEEIGRQAELRARQKYLQQEVKGALAEAKTLYEKLHRQLEDPLQVHELLSDVDSWEALVQRAQTARQRAQSLADSAPDLLEEDLTRRLHHWQTQLKADEQDLQLARELDTIRLETSTLVEGQWHPTKALARYATVLAQAGYDVKQPDSKALAARIRRSPVRLALVAALDHWAGATTDRQLRPKLLALGRHADPDPWRIQVRDALGREDVQQLQSLVAQVEVSRQSPQILLALVTQLPPTGGRRAALLRRALVPYPRDFWLHFDLATVTTDPVESMGCYQAALAVRPRSSAAHNNWGVALETQKDYASAITRFQEALRFNRKFAWAHLNWGNALQAQKDYAGAIEHYRQAVQMGPNDPRAHVSWGAALAAQKDYAGAVRHYQQALKIDPKYALAENAWGLALATQKDYAGAIRHYQQAVQFDSRDAIAHTNWGLALAAQQDYAGAIEHYQQAVQLNANDALAQNAWGAALAEQKDYAGAIEHYQRAVQLDPNDAAAHVNWGLALAAQKDYAGAARHYQQAVQLDPNDAVAHYSWGVALEAQKDHAGAIEHYQQAVALNPNHARAHTNWGAILDAQKDSAGAIRHYQQAIKLDSNDVKAHYNWGLALAAQKDYAGASEQYRQAVQLDPRDAKTHYNWGNALYAQKNYDGAIAHYRQATELEPNYARAHYNWGRALHDQRNHAGAIHHYRQAIQLDPNHALAHSALGQALLQTGEFEQALQTLQRALQLLPPGHAVRSIVQDLLQDCQRQRQLVQRAQAVVQGQAPPAQRAEQLRLAQVCRQYRRYSAAARLYATVLTSEPALAEDLAGSHRYHAACAAVLAAAGQGLDADNLTAAEKTKLRRQAQDWLQADLRRFTSIVAASRDGGKPGSQPPAAPLAKLAGQNQRPGLADLLWVCDRLRQWQTVPDLASVRDDKQLPKLAADEQAAWRQLWEQVRVLDKQARAGFTNRQLTGQLTAQQPEQVQQVLLQAGKTYVLDLENTTFAPRLRLEDAQGKKLAEIDTKGPAASQHARIVFTPSQDGTYRLVASAFPGQGTGTYTLTIREFTGSSR